MGLPYGINEPNYFKNLNGGSCDGSHEQKLDEIIRLLTSIESKITGTTEPPIKPPDPIVKSCKFKILPVGGSDCQVIQVHGKNIVIDCSYTENSATIKQELDRRGITTIDYFIATHSHSDHIGGIKTLTDNYTIKQAYYRTPRWEIVNQIPNEVSWRTQEFHENMVKALTEKGVPQSNFPEMIDLGEGSYIRFYNQPDDSTNHNHWSTMTLLVHDGVKMLFGADYTQGVWSKMEGKIGKVDFLKIPHHGILDGVSRYMLTELKPRYAVNSTHHKSTTYPIDDQVKEGVARCQVRNIKYMGTNTSGIEGYVSNGMLIMDDKNVFKHKNYWHYEEDKVFFIKSDGVVAINSWAQDTDGRWYHFDANGYMEKSKWIWGAGKVVYYVKENGAMAQNEWLKENNNWYWLKADGNMARSESININGKNYIFNEHGVCQNP